MEEVTTREHSSDSIATSEEFEDLGHKNASELKPNEEMLDTQVEEIKIKNKTSPEMEIGNNGNMADLKETLNEVLNEESENSGRHTKNYFLYNFLHTHILFISSKTSKIG